jgi:hypothetical protein
MHVTPICLYPFPCFFLVYEIKAKKKDKNKKERNDNKKKEHENKK